MFVWFGVIEPEEVTMPNVGKRGTLLRSEEKMDWAQSQVLLKYVSGNLRAPSYWAEQ